jgi:hypothetical protein
MRGCLVRSKLGAARREALELKRIRREKEMQEVSLMTKEDSLSRAYENMIRSNLEEQRKLEEKRQLRLQQERDRKLKHWNRCATKIQKIVRGMFSRLKTKIKKCETHLERAISSRSEEALAAAIKLTEKMNLKSKTTKEICQNAKILLTTVQGELFVKLQLDDAVRMRSEELIREAMRLAEDAGMTYLEEFSRAKQSFDKEIKRKSVLQHIEIILDRCNTVPNLVKHSDKLNDLVSIATSLGLSGEYLVQDARNRLGRIQSLLRIRNDIRYAVELCSASMMQKAMEARHQLLKIYGPELFAEEAHAVLKMLQMYVHEEQIVKRTDSENAKRDSSEVTEENIMSQGANKSEDGETTASCDATTTDDSRKGAADNDVRLPPFVRKQLELIRDARAAAGKIIWSPSYIVYSSSLYVDLQEATEKLVILVPNEEKRKVLHFTFGIRKLIHFPGLPANLQMDCVICNLEV